MTKEIERPKECEKMYSNGDGPGAPTKERARSDTGLFRLSSRNRKSDFLRKDNIHLDAFGRIAHLRDVTASDYPVHTHEQHHSK